MRTWCVPLASANEWRMALADISHGFAHTWEFCSAIAQTTRYDTFLLGIEAAEGRAVCPLSVRPIGQYADVVTPYGFGGFVGTLPAEQVRQAWRQFVREQEYVCGFHTVNPFGSMAAVFALSDLFQAAVLYVLDLSLGVESLEQRLDENRSRQVRGWHALGPRHVTSDKERLLPFLVREYDDFVARRGAAPTYRFTAQTLERIVLSQNVAIHGWHDEGVVKAVVVCGWSDTAADYLFNVSLPGEERHSAMLVWSAIVDLVNRGLATLNLGGGIRPGDGVARFKERFGPRAIPLLCAKEIYREDVYDTLCGSETARSRVGYFPPYRAPGHAASAHEAEPSVPPRQPTGRLR
jgi:hypothetical protein